MNTLSELIKSELALIIKEQFNIDLKNVHVEKPDNEQFGHYATNVPLILAKELKRKPFEIAQDIADFFNEKKISFNYDGVSYPVFKTVEGVVPGFVNFHLSVLWLKKRLVDIYTDQDSFGKSDVGLGKKVLIEYSQPNPNKPMHIGHSRNNFLGNSLCRLYEFLGYDVTRVNYVNDWGTHICKAMLMYQRLANGDEPTEKSDHYVGKFYHAYEQEIEKSPELASELSEMFRKLESGDAETLVLWQKIVNWTLAGHRQTYEREGIGFDVWMYQHAYKDSGKEIVNMVLEKGVAEKDSTGAVVARLTPFGLPDKVLLRSDGTSIYSTQDLQMAKDNYDKYSFDKKIYITDYRQSDYFKQIFKILEIFGFDWSSRLAHLGYGTVDLPEGTMSSRKGLVINADSVLDRLIDLENSELATSGREVKNLEDVSRKVALAAYKYSMLRVDPLQIVVFDYDKVTKFDGNTGPYLLYTYARALSILEKGGLPKIKLTDFVGMTLDLLPEELELLGVLYRLEEVVLEAVSKMSPSELAHYAYDVCQRFNTMYAKVPVLNAKMSEQKDFRLGLIACTAQVIKNTLDLLGIDVVEKM